MGSDVSDHNFFLQVKMKFLGFHQTILQTKATFIDLSNLAIIHWSLSYRHQIRYAFYIKQKMHIDNLDSN